jgi:membrane fusion protein (multidrug efflux system)
MKRIMKKYLFAIAAFATSLGGHAEPVQGVVHAIKQVGVSAPVIQEIITKVLVREGDTVKEGDVIVELRREREELDVKLSEKLIDHKRFIARGQQKLYKEEMGSEERALAAKTDLEIAELQLEAKRIALREKTVVAPLSGRVVKKYKEAGESVAREEKLVDIINTDKVTVRFNVPPAQRRLLKEQAAVDVKINDLDGAAFSGRITFIDPRNDLTSTTVPVWVEIDNADHRISPGMRGVADFGK